MKHNTASKKVSVCSLPKVLLEVRKLAGVEEAKMARLVHRIISRRKIDTSRMDIKTSHGVVYLRGRVTKIRGENFDLKEEMEVIRKMLRLQQGIREVHMEDLLLR